MVEVIITPLPKMKSNTRRSFILYTRQAPFYLNQKKYKESSNDSSHPKPPARAHEAGPYTAGVEQAHIPSGRRVEKIVIVPPSPTVVVIVDAAASVTVTVDSAALKTVVVCAPPPLTVSVAVTSMVVVTTD